MAVSDGDGYFCIHDTLEGEWVVTSFEPFTFRPFVRELTCTAGTCDLGDVRVDEHLLRISDDFVGFGDGWWGGAVAQTVIMPERASFLVKVTFRSGAESTNDVRVYSGEGVSTDPLAIEHLHFSGHAGSSRATATFAPGAVAVEPGGTYTIVLGGGSAPWRLTGDAYNSGQMFSVDEGARSITPIPDTDLCLTMDVDGPDGNVTSFNVAGNDGFTFGYTVVQSFVARSTAITHASLVSGTPDGLRRIRASIHDSIDGPAIGPVRETQGLGQQGVAFGWFADEVPVTPGDTYYLRFEFPDSGGYAVYTRTSDPNGSPVYPEGRLYANDDEQEGSIWGRIMGPFVEEPLDPDGDGDADTDRDTDEADGDADLDADTDTDAEEDDDEDWDVGGSDERDGGEGCGCRAADYQRSSSRAFAGLFSGIFHPSRSLP